MLYQLLAYIRVPGSDVASSGELIRGVERHDLLAADILY